MINGSEDKAGDQMSLSALADGELDAAATAAACAYWRGDAQARASWHAYHLIGDVMRSDELATDAQRDSRFLHRLRERLASEPVVLAPTTVERSLVAARRSSSAAAKGRRSAAWAWMAPAAVAAGFMALASVLVLNGAAVPVGGPINTLAQAVGSSTTQLQAAGASSLTTAAPGDPQSFVADGKLIRDARLERYFAAHTQFGGTSALGVPSGFLRAATTQPQGR